MNSIQKQISRIIRGSACALCSVFVGVIWVFLVMGFASGESVSGPTSITLTVIGVAWFGMLIYSVVLYLMGVYGLGQRLDDVGKMAMNYILGAVVAPFMACVLILVLESFDVDEWAMPIWLVTIVVSIVLYGCGCWILLRSSSLNKAGFKGAKNLRTSIMLALLMVIIGIPYYVWNEFMPSYVAKNELVYGLFDVIYYVSIVAIYVLAILSLIFTFVGWGQIRRSFAN